MAKKFDVLKCSVCGNIVELVHVGGGKLVCCGKNMDILEEKTADTSAEKHVPFIEKVEGGYNVKIGEKAKHPMTEEHYIEFIEVIADSKVYTKYLKSGSEPEAFFPIDAENIIVREYCNLHGLWKNIK